MSALRHNRIIVAFKVVAWTAMALVLLAAGMLMCVVYTLSPNRLTPLVAQIANRSLNAHVNIERVELTLRSTYPFLNIDADDVTILSTDILQLPRAARDTLPEWADTLATVRHIHGGINLAKLFNREIELHDVEITHPKINVLVVNENINNFSIARTFSEESDTTYLRPTDVRINHFEIRDPGPVKYADLSQQMSASLNVKALGLTRQGHPKDYLPLYHVDFKGDFWTPLLDIIGRNDIEIDIDGIVEWHYKAPYRLVMKDFVYKIAMLSGKFDTTIDFSDRMTVEKFVFDMDPVAINDLLSLVPPRVAKERNLPRRLYTDATLRLSGKIDRPYVAGQLFLPHGSICLEVPNCHLRYDRTNLNHLSGQLFIGLHGGTPDQIVVDIPALKANGAGISLSFTGRITDLMSDPRLVGEICGNAAISQLPKFIINHSEALWKGRVSLDTRLDLRRSMLTAENLHRIRLNGDVGVDHFYYLRNDTLLMVAATKANVNFTTQRTPTDTTPGPLRAVVDIDSTDILVSGLDIKGGNVRLSLDALETKHHTLNSAVVPVSGHLRVGSFSLLTLSDTAGVRIKEIEGPLIMRRSKVHPRLPRFDIKWQLGRVSAGSKNMRIMLDDALLKASFDRLPTNRGKSPEKRQKVRRRFLTRPIPFIPIDSVYVYAKAIRHRHSIPGHHHVHTQPGADSTRVVNWGPGKFAVQLFNDWKWSGNLTTQGARMFTTAFPVRNRIENLAVKFCNDTAALSNVEYKAGRSDFLISGNITNLVKGFTSPPGVSPLKINFEVLSDTVEINELSLALFSGAALSSKRLNTTTDDANILDRQILDDIHHNGRRKAPLIIPTNIDARLGFHAKNALYSDILLQDLCGTLLMYDGSLNLHNLAAASYAGKVEFSALYSAQSADDLHFGFGLQLTDFNISNFLKIVPAVDSLMPLMRHLSGIVNADVAATSRINRNMDIDLPSLQAAIRIQGDSVTFIDPTTFNRVAKWLLFKNRNRNIIDNFTAELIVDDGKMRVFPFIFDFDRYRLGVQGYNDFNLNLHYHVAVLKSPIPFKFGINITGRPPKMRFRFGGAHIDPKEVALQSPVANETRINLINQIQDVFRRGVRDAGFAKIKIAPVPLAKEIDLATDTLSAADSLYLKQTGLMP